MIYLGCLVKFAYPGVGVLPYTRLDRLPLACLITLYFSLSLSLSASLCLSLPLSVSLCLSIYPPPPCCRFLQIKRNKQSQLTADLAEVNVGWEAPELAGQQLYILLYLLHFPAPYLDFLKEGLWPCRFKCLVYGISTIYHIHKMIFGKQC